MKIIAAYDLHNEATPQHRHAVRKALEAEGLYHQYDAGGTSLDLPQTTVLGQMKVASASAACDKIRSLLMNITGGRPCRVVVGVYTEFRAFNGF